MQRNIRIESTNLHLHNNDIPFHNAGGMLSELQMPQEFQVPQLERYDSSVLRREAESALFAISLSSSTHRYSKETLQAVLDARCIVDGSIQETARWPTECQVNIDVHFIFPRCIITT